MNTPKCPTIAELEANLDKEVAWAESLYRPQVSGRMTGRGRPRKGVDIEPTVPHSIRVKPSIWAALTLKAQDAGLTPNAAAQLALLEWARR